MGRADRKSPDGGHARSSRVAAWRQRRAHGLSLRTSGTSPERDAISATRLSGSGMVSSTAFRSFQDRVREILSSVPDPEIPCVSVVELGIVRAVRDDTVVITPT